MTFCDEVFYNTDSLQTDALLCRHSIYRHVKNSSPSSDDENKTSI